MHRALALLAIVVVGLAAACGPAAPAQPAAAPAQPAPAQPAAAPAQPAQAKPAKAPEPAKPAAAPAQPAKPAAAAPAQPKAEAKPAAAGGKQRMLMGSSAVGTAFYTYAVALARLWNAKAPEIEVTVTESGGGLDNLRRVDSGQFQLGLTPTDLNYQAWHAIEDFKDKPLRNQRYLFTLGATPTAFVVRKETNIAKLEDLEGKDWTPGQKGSAAEKHTINIMAALGIKPKYYSAAAQDMIQATKDRRTAGFVRPAASPKAMDSATQEVHVVTPLRMLSFAPEQEKIVREKFPYIPFLTVEKDQLASGFPDQRVRTIGIVVGASVHKDVTADLAYKLTKLGVEDNKPGGEGLQAGAFPAVKGVDFAQETVDTVITPLHAGAVRYYREIGKQLKPEQLPPDAR